MLKFYSKKNKFLSKYFFAILMICLFGKLTSQDRTIERIDSLMEASQIDNFNGDYKSFLAKQNKTLQESRKNNYSKGIAMSYHYIGVCYQQLGDCGKALTFYNKALKEKYTQTDLSLQSDINCSIGNCYRQQYLYKDALEKYRAAIRIGEKSNGDINFIKSMNYNNIATVHQVFKETEDSAYYYYSKANYYSKYLPKDKLKRNRRNLKPVICINIGDYWERNKRLDSTDYYYSKAILINKEVQNVIMEAMLEYRLGVMHFNAHNYKKANDYLEKAKSIFEGKHDIATLQDIYMVLRELNKNIGNKKKYDEYQDLLIKINTQVNATHSSGVMATVDSIINEKNEAFERKEARLYWIIGGVILLSILIWLVCFQYYKSMKQKKETLISNSEKTLEEKRLILSQKEQETSELKLKINESFAEVVRLAKENNPEFLIRFQEVYPDFYHRIASLEPKLLTTELKLCAMIYLGFSSKDIADYDFVTLKAVQHRKFRLRKKLNIPSDLDINVWLNGVA